MSASNREFTRISELEQQHCIYCDALYINEHDCEGETFAHWYNNKD